MSKLYYVQNTRSYVGNSILWWKDNNSGYTCDIRRAKVFTETEARELCLKVSCFRAWPKKYIDEKIEHHIDMQNCNEHNSLHDGRRC